MKRLLDIFSAIILMIVFAFPMILIGLAVVATSPGPALYWSDRVGRENKLFRMPKFRSMRVDAPAIATHLLTDTDNWLTPLGSFLRKSSLDEIPQLWSVLTGDMSIVGPRPALFNQDDLIALRTTRGVHCLRPGITGWAQVNGRDELEIPEKVSLDAYYLARRSLLLDGRIVLMTIGKVTFAKNITH